MFNIFLYSAYYIVALLYLASGFILLIRPSIIHHLIPSLFPLLASFKRQRIENSLNLIAVGIVLVLVGNWIVEAKFLGFLIALILSAWEVFLSIAFYLKRKETINALVHFVVHIALVVLIGWFMISHYSIGINKVESSIITTFLFFLFGGEPAVLIISSLSVQQNLYPFYVLIIIAYLSAILGETFWFLMARSPVIRIFGSKFSESYIHNKLMLYGNKIERGKPLQLLFLTRFISGLTILVIIFLSRNKMSFKRFISYCFIVNLFWAPIVVLTGWSAGKGFTLLLNILESLETTLFIASIVLVIAYFLYKKLVKKVETNLKD